MIPLKKAMKRCPQRKKRGLYNEYSAYCVMMLDSVGRMLRETREGMGLTLDQVAKSAGVSRRYLDDLEEGGCEVPADIYAREFLHRYARTLNLSGPDLWKKFTEEKRWCTTQPRLEFQELPTSSWFGPRQWRVAMGAVVLGVMALYLTTSLSSALASPVLDVEMPADNIKTSVNEIVVRGRVSGSSSSLTINNVVVVPQGDGQFSFPVVLNQGLNTITVEAVRQKNRKTSVVRHVLVEVLDEKEVDRK